MSEIPSELKYTSSHEWVRVDEDGIATVGITDYAQHALGDLVFVELPELEAELSAGNECGVVESVKAASDIYCPITGMVVEINEKLLSNPELVNQDPYGDGWIFRLQSESLEELDELLDADAYQEKISAEEE